MTHHLPPNSVNSFDTLETRFGTQFATSRPHHLTSMALVNIRQEKKELLGTFMECFGRIALNICNLDPTVTMHHLITTLRLKAFVSSLVVEGEWCKDQIRVKKEVREYYQKRFKEQGSMQVLLDEVHFKSINDEYNNMLTQIFSKEETKNVIWDCEGDKSLDRMTSTLTSSKYVGM